MATPFLGEIRMFAGNFAPAGWAFCDGTLLPINSHTALFALLGVFYGGNGTSNFALPDLRGRVPVDAGTTFTQGAAQGSEQVTLLSSEMPAHSHPVYTSAASPSPALGPATSLLANSAPIYSPTAASTTMFPTSTSGGNQPHENMAPSLAINFIIALTGIFPSRP